MNGIGGFNNTNAEKTNSSVSLTEMLRRIILSLYSFLEKSLSETAFVKLIRSFASSTSRFFSFLGRKVNKGFENSFILSKLDNLDNFLLEKSLRYYGVALFFYGLFSLMFSFIGGLNRYKDIVELLYSDVTVILPALFTVLIATVMMTSDSSLASNILRSRVLSSLFFEYLCFDKKRVESITPRYHTHTMPVIVGMALSILFIWISPIFAVKCIFYLICILAIMKTPENGIVLTFLLLPFADTKTLVGLLGLAATAYLLKMFRMKRVFKLGLYDCFLSLFGFVVFVCGISSVNCSGCKQNAVIILLCMFFGFIIANTMKTSSLAERCVNAILLSSSVLALLMILLFFAERYGIHAVHPAVSFLFDFLSALPFADNPSVFELFILLLPLALSKRRISDGGKNVTAGLTSLILLLAALVLSFDGSIWLSILFAFVVYYCVLKPILIIPSAFLTALSLILLKVFPLLSSLLRHLFVDILGVSFDFGRIQNASEYGLKLLSEVGLAGVGAGSEAVQNVASGYFGNGISEVIPDMTFSLSILLQYGVVGIVVILICYLVFLSKNAYFYYCECDLPSVLKPYIASAVATVTFMLLKGLFLPSLISVHSLVVFCFLLYFGTSVKSCILTDYVPRGADILGYKDS